VGGRHLDRFGATREGIGGGGEAKVGGAEQEHAESVVRRCVDPLTPHHGENRMAERLVFA
jgi:hypothetical protein